VPDLAVEGFKLRPDAVKIEQRIDLEHQMVQGNLILKPNVIEQPLLITLKPP
jgi:hypothetical protein